MSPRKAVLDTNIYIHWFNAGLHEELIFGPGLIAYLSGIVQMELRIGAYTLRARHGLDQLAKRYAATGRVVVPDVNDVLIAHCARSIGATVYTADKDYEAIRAVLEFDLELV